MAASLILCARALPAQTFPSQLGLSERDAETQLVSSVTTGSPEFGLAARAFKALPPGARAAVAAAGMAWGRAYVKSPLFRKSYADARVAAKPTPNEYSETVDQELARQVAEQLASLEESRKMLGSLPADQRKEVEATLKLAEEQIKSPAMQAVMRAQIAEDRKAAAESHKDALVRWEERYPANPDVLVAKRLREFLSECGDVDFDARTVSREGRTRFALTEHEQDKSSTWKLCYRAGREAVTAARSAAEAWLLELRIEG